jgi:ribonuclease HII
MRTRPDPSLEDYFRTTGSERVAGVDEVGAGAWAGPVIAAAVILLPEYPIEALNEYKLFRQVDARHCSR